MSGNLGLLSFVAGTYPSSRPDRPEARHESQRVNRKKVTKERVASSSSARNQDPLDYYRSHGRMTNPGEEARMFEDLPRDVAALCNVVQGLVVHPFWAQRYGLTLPPDREQELQVRTVEGKLELIRKLDDRPLTEPRVLEKRLVGNCRDFSLMLCSMLKHQGVPARARCGFAVYFEPKHFEDHWVCEYWHEGRRWAKVDAQLDAFQRDNLGIRFSPLDVPDDQFLVGGRAWQMCRAGEADPDAFGVFDLHGLWFVRGDLVRDLAALNKMELLPWDSWGLMDREEKDLSGSDLSLLDQVAGATQNDNGRFEETLSVYQDNSCLRVPSVIKSHTKTGVQTVRIET
jgi:Transglutaminase-like superfamily